MKSGKFRTPLSHRGLIVADARTEKLVSIGTGRRKTAVARIRLTEGSGKISVNGLELDEFFTKNKDRSAIVDSLALTKMRSRLDVDISVQGGSLAGQAGAAAQGIVRALNRMKRRKRYGTKGERKTILFSKGGPPVLQLSQSGKIKRADIRKAVLAVRDRKLRGVD